MKNIKIILIILGSIAILTGLIFLIIHITKNNNPSPPSPTPPSPTPPTPTPPTPTPPSPTPPSPTPPTPTPPTPTPPSPTPPTPTPPTPTPPTPTPPSPTPPTPTPPSPTPPSPTPPSPTPPSPPTPTGPGTLKEILPNTEDGKKLWLKIFPILDPTSYQYKSRNCQNSDSKNGRPDWASGCTMWGSGERNGLDNFHKACENFPEFCNGPDKNRNIMELASFLGNVTQETGDPTINSGLVFSAEMGSSQNSLFGKGALQLTGAINYQKATMGIDKELTGKCNTDAVDTSKLGACWENCVNSSPVKPPKGSGYNVCKEPSLASSNPIVGWSVSLWYWLNRPIATDVAQNFFGLEGDIKNATAHNLIQNPKYNCDIWCPVTAIAQIGCPSCCVGKTEKLDPMTVNRVGGYVKIASILGLPLAQKSSQDQYFCKLLQFCKQGFNPDTLNCPAGISYQKYAVGDHWCGGVKFTPGKYFGNCVPTPGSYTSAEQCASCLQGSMTYWPCSATAGCKWDNKS